MKVILLSDVKGVGKRFDEKNVSDGYAQNFLLPKSLAVVADASGQARVANLKAHSDARKAVEEKVLSEKEAKRLEKHRELEKFRESQKLKQG
jgi:large subunit ribosomal protein L9